MDLGGGCVDLGDAFGARVDGDINAQAAGTKGTGERRHQVHLRRCGAVARLSGPARDGSARDGSAM